MLVYVQLYYRLGKNGIEKRKMVFRPNRRVRIVSGQTTEDGMSGSVSIRSKNSYDEGSTGSISVTTGSSQSSIPSGDINVVVLLLYDMLFVVLKLLFVFHN